jgi:AcrR family transcriptional regulator
MVAPAPTPRFRRPTPDDAVDIARELLDEGERVDVLAVATRLGVSRATVHRWFGTRDQLMTALFAHLAAEFRERAERQARGHGDERAIDFVRRIAKSSAAYDPLRVAAAREPTVFLRLMLREDGPVHAEVVDTLMRLLAGSHTPVELRRLRGAVDLFASTAIALHWSTIATGGEPDPRRYARIGRALLADARR